MSLRLNPRCMILRNLRNEGLWIFDGWIRISPGQVFYEVVYELEFIEVHGAIPILNALSSYFSYYSEPFSAFLFSPIHFCSFPTPVSAWVSSHRVTLSAVFWFFPLQVSRVIIFSQHWLIIPLLTHLLRNSILFRLVRKCYRSWRTIRMIRSVIISWPLLGLLLSIIIFLSCFFIIFSDLLWMELR